jgi:parallel beta-helix repeat protein
MEPGGLRDEGSRQRAERDADEPRVETLSRVTRGLSDELEHLNREREAGCPLLRSTSQPRAMWSLEHVRKMLVHEGAGGRSESLDSSPGVGDAYADAAGRWVVQPVSADQTAGRGVPQSAGMGVPHDVGLGAQDEYAAAGSSMLEEEVMRAHADLEADSSSPDSLSPIEGFSGLETRRHDVADCKIPPVQLLPRNNSASSLFDGLESLTEEETLNRQTPDRGCVASGAHQDAAAANGPAGDFSPNEEARGPRGLQTVHEVFVASAKRSFKSIAEALRNAGAGEVIQLTHGTYVEHEPLEVLVDNVILCCAPGNSAAGEAAFPVEIQLRGPRACLVCRAKGLEARQMKLVQSASSQPQQNASTCDTGGKSELGTACVAVLSGDASFVSCSITSSVGHGFYICGDASPSLKFCSIDKCADVAVLCRGRCCPMLLCNTLRKNKSVAIAMMDSSAGSLVGNTISKSSKCAVICSGDSSTIFLRNDVRDGTQGAFWIQGSSRARLVNNTMRNNVKAGLQVSNRANPMVSGNKIEFGQGGGIVVHDDACGHFCNNTIENSMRAGIGVMDRAAPYLEANIIRGNQGGGAVITGTSSPVLVFNKLSSNGVVGVGLKESCSPVLIDNTVEENGGYGMLLQGGCCVQVRGCNIVGNARAGVCVCDDAQLTMDECVMEPRSGGGKGEGAQQVGAQQGFGQQVFGLVLQDLAKAIVRKCIFRHHSVLPLPSLLVFLLSLVVFLLSLCCSVLPISSGGYPLMCDGYNKRGLFLDCHHKKPRITSSNRFTRVPFPFFRVFLRNYLV